jgi:two-component sensor histidine kinase
MRLVAETYAPPALQPLHLVEEISHRVVNEYAEAIAALALAEASSGEAASRRALRSAADRLFAQAQAHRALLAPVADGQIDLGEHIARICRQLAGAPIAERVQLTVSSDEIFLDAGVCWRIGLIIAELVRNAARHGLRGGPGAILVQVSELASDVCCWVSDTGRSDASEPPAGRGQRILRALAAELEGSIDWAFTPHGCRVCLVVPRPPARLATTQQRRAARPGSRPFSAFLREVEP